MNNNINSISRIHEILLSIAGTSDQRRVLDVWAQAFDVNETEDIKKAALVSEKLVLLLEELELAKNEIEKKFTKNAYNTMVESLNNAFSPMLLPAGWNSIQHYLSSDVMASLAIYREALPNEEQSINIEELNELHARMSELEIFLESSSLPDRVIQLIKRHIKLIREALSNYKITGAIALIEARRASYGEFFEVKEILQKDYNPEEISKLKAIWSGLNKLTDGALKAYGLYEIGKEALPAFEQFLK